MEPYHIAIIGGGISGISFALKAQKHGLSSITLEQNARLGGCIETFHSPKADDFWIEMGAHTLYNSYHHALSYCAQNHLINDISKRQKHPFKLITQDHRIESIFKRLNLLRASIAWPLFMLTSAHSKTVKQYFSSLFGKQNYDQALQYCFNAALCQNSQNFPADFLFKRRKKNKQFPRSFTFQNGLGTLLSNEAINTLNIKLNSACQDISYQNGLWHIQTEGNTICSEKLLLATPWHVTQALLAKANHPIAQLQHQPSLSTLQTAGIILDKHKTKHIAKLAGLIGIAQDFYSVVSRDVIDHHQYRGLSVHFHNLTENPRTLAMEFLDKLNIDRSAVIDINYKKNHVPMYHRRHQEFLNSLNTLLSKGHHLYLSGNYFTRLAIEDCVRRSDEEFERLLTNSHTG